MKYNQNIVVWRGEENFVNYFPLIIIIIILNEIKCDGVGSVASCQSLALESIAGCCGGGARAVLELELAWLLLTRSCLSPSRQPDTVSYHWTD